MKMDDGHCAFSMTIGVSMYSLWLVCVAQRFVRLLPTDVVRGSSAFCATSHFFPLVMFDDHLHVS